MTLLLTHNIFWLTMTTTTFKINNTSNDNYTFPTTNYSTILDNIIAANIKATNKYLNCGTIDDDFISTMMADSKKKHMFDLTGSYLNDDDKFIKAANFIANYKKTTKKLPFILGKTYKLINGTPIIFYDDEIQIGLDLYSYSDFGNIKFLNTLNEPTKKIIINIFNAGNSKITINL